MSLVGWSRKNWSPCHGANSHLLRWTIRQCLNKGPFNNYGFEHSDIFCFVFPLSGLAFNIAVKTVIQNSRFMWFGWRWKMTHKWTDCWGVESDKACPKSPWQNASARKLLLPGGKYSVRSRRRYREQSMLAIDMMSKALMQAGISPDAGMQTILFGTCASSHSLLLSLCL